MLIFFITYGSFTFNSSTFNCESFDCRSSNCLCILSCKSRMDSSRFWWAHRSVETRSKICWSLFESSVRFSISFIIRRIFSSLAEICNIFYFILSPMNVACNFPYIFINTIVIDNKHK